MSNEDFTAKDFRTWAGTVLTCVLLRELEAFRSETEAKKNVVQVIKKVAKRLGNTPSLCRKRYVHPAVLECYFVGGMMKVLKRRVEKQGDPSDMLRQQESALMRLRDDFLIGMITAAARLQRTMSSFVSLACLEK
jgi:DNA topoisomerase-1